MDDKSDPGDKESPDDRPNRSPEPTIVGGRPFASGGARYKIPHGIEVLVKKASIDPDFRKLLLDKRSQAAAEIGLDLSAAETAMLNSIPQAQIAQIIANTTVPDEHRRVFLGKIGTAMVALIGIGLSAACGTHGIRVYQGSAPDLPRPSVNSVLVDPKDERLKIEVLDGGKTAVTVKVQYDCPYEKGDVGIMFGRRPDLPRAEVNCNPLMVRAAKGCGESTFRAEGTGGQTEGLLVSLVRVPAYRENNEIDRQALYELEHALPGLRPGEYAFEGYMIYKVAEFRKDWPS